MVTHTNVQKPKGKIPTAPVVDHVAPPSAAAEMGNQAMLSVLRSQGGGEDASQGELLIDRLRRRSGSAEEMPDVSSAKSRRFGSNSLPNHIQAKFEQRFGVSMDDVNVYRNSPKPSELGALAYAKGSDVFIGPGQEQYLEHELGHVVQQKYGLVKPTARIGGLPVNLDQGLERQADALSISGEQAAQENSVVQMEPVTMPHQIRNDCGFNALARAIATVQSNNGNSFNTLLKKKKLEQELASYAINNNLSMVGEAFDPDTLTFTCNEYCKAFNIDVKARTVSFKNKERLKEIIKNENNKGSVILFPYFTTNGDRFLPTDSRSKYNEEEKENAHWAVLDPSKNADTGTIPLYEGTRYGIEGTQEADVSSTTFINQMIQFVTPFIGINL